MATTTNYGWTTPDDTALVKDGAAAIRTFGTSVDTTTKALNPSTTLGDIEYRSSTANTNTRLGIGSSGQVLTVAAGVPSWATGFANPLTTTGDVIYSSSGTTAARLGIGSSGQVLSVSAGVPAWTTPTAGGSTLLSTTTLSGTTTTISSISQSYKHLQIIIENGYLSAGSNDTFIRLNSDASSLYSYGILNSFGPDARYAQNKVSLMDHTTSTTTPMKQIRAVIDIYRYTNTDAVFGTISALAYYDGVSRFQSQAIQFVYDCSAAITSIDIIGDVSFSGGTAYVYGVN
jgi:hypothetical protein